MNLKSFDIFRKIQSEVHSGSVTGGIFTLFALIVIFFRQLDWSNITPSFTQLILYSKI